MQDNAESLVMYLENLKNPYTVEFSGLLEYLMAFVKRKKNNYFLYIHKLIAVIFEG